MSIGPPTALPAPRRIVVVGASLAGLRAAEELRHRGFDGVLTLVGAEAHLPYDRPPLSKDFLSGATDRAGIELRRQPYDDLELDLRLGVRATQLDTAARVLATDAGEQLDYDRLVIATGAAPRRLPDQPDLAGIHVLRTVDDAEALRADLAGSPRVVVVGAGFVGAETAATCRGLGLSVTVLEALPSPMVRGLGPALGDTLTAMHRDHGVDLHLGVGVAGFRGTARVEAVVLDNGRTVDADVVLVAVGVVPVTDWLASSGLILDNGLVCDATLSAAPGVVAAGDVVRWPNPAFGGALMRLEHWTNAAEQGVAAAVRALASETEAPEFSSIPFVWSDQYDVKIQVVGHISGVDEMAVVDGSLEERRFVAVFGREGRTTGAVGFNRPRLVMRCRGLLAEGLAFADTVERMRA